MTARCNGVPSRLAWLRRVLPVTLLLGGCTGNVTMLQPRTGRTAVCRESAHGLDPWSQTDACVAGYETQGWVRAATSE